MPRIKLNHFLARPFYRVLILAILSVGLVPAQAFAQNCSWSDTSVVPAPDVTYLRAFGDDVKAPTRVAADRAGNIYTVDPGTGHLVKNNLLGKLDQIIPGLGTPSAVAVDSTGAVFVANADDGSVSVYDRNWNLLFQLGQGAGEFINPNDISIDPDPAADTVYVSDGNANLIKVYDLNGSWKFSFDGSASVSGDALRPFNFPSAVHISDAGDVIVGDQNNDRVAVFDRQGVFLHCFGSESGPGWFSLKFGRILGITSDSLGRIYVADGFQGEVKVFDADGAKLAIIGAFGEQPGQLRTPMGLALDPFNRLWVTSVNNGRIEVFGIDDFDDPQGFTAIVWVDPTAFKWPKPDRGMKVFLRVDGIDATEIDIASVRANGAETRKNSSKDWKLGDFDGDGIPEWRGKFDAREVLAGLDPGEVPVVVTGMLFNGLEISGTYLVTFAADDDSDDDSDDESDDDSDDESDDDSKGEQS